MLSFNFNSKAPCPIVLLCKGELFMLCKVVDDFVEIMKGAYLMSNMLIIHWIGFGILQCTV